MNSDTIVVIASILFWGGFIIGAVCITLESSNGSLAVIETDFLDNYCKMKFGENYAYLDDVRWHADENITCHYVYEDIKSGEIESEK